MFINRAKEVHGDRYGYNNVSYVSTTTKVDVTCTIHGDFLVTPSNHLTSASGCPVCARSQSGTTQNNVAASTFINDSVKVHGQSYDYSKVEYVNAHKKVVVVCKIHGDFLIAPYSHRQGSVCKHCSIEHRAKNQTLTTIDFIERATKKHNNKYIYDNTEYASNAVKLQISCPSHGPFMQRAGQHLRGEGCPECGSYSWFAEQGGYSARYFEMNPSEQQKSGILYLLRFTSQTEEFYKIGITTTTIKQRYHWGYLDYNIDVILEHPTTIYDAWQREQAIISMFKHQRYIPSIKIGGYTECLTKHIDVDSIRRLVID